MSSLSARLAAALSVLLLVFFGATIVVLDLVFRTAAERAVEDRLEVQLIVLLGAAEDRPGQSIEFPEELPEARFMTPGSGLYGLVTTPEGERLWRSRSFVGSDGPRRS